MPPGQARGPLGHEQKVKIFLEKPAIVFRNARHALVVLVPGLTQRGLPRVRIVDTDH